MIATEIAQNLESRIRRAYAQIADERGQPQPWVMLAALRPYIGGHRDQVDEVLNRMASAGAIRLVPETNQKVLRDEERAAAVLRGNQPKHLIQIP